MGQENKNFCTLYLVRHGETKWNKSGIITGHLDSPLSDDGLEQTWITAQRLKDVHFDAIFSSDLHRAIKTAEIIKLERQLVIQTSTALRGRTFGRYEGTPGEKYRKKFQHLLDKMKQLTEKEQKELKFDHDIESDEEVANRFTTQLREIAVVHPNKTVLVVTHGGCIRTFLMHTGYVKYGELPIGSFPNASHAKVLSDGVHFFIKKVRGLK